MPAILKVGYNVFKTKYSIQNHCHKYSRPFVSILREVLSTIMSHKYLENSFLPFLKDFTTCIVKYHTYKIKSV